MAEFIEREKAIEAIWKPVVNPGSMIFDALKTACQEEAKRIPAAGVRPVVLCRDCKYAPIGDNDGSDLEWPFNEFDENPCPYKCLDNWYSHKPAPDFFCAAGEKKEKS